MKVTIQLTDRERQLLMQAATNERTGLTAILHQALLDGLKAKNKRTHQNKYAQFSLVDNGWIERPA